MKQRENYAPYILRMPNDETKAKCVKCLEDKQPSEYYKHSERKDGFNRYRQICKKCRKKVRKNKSRPVHENIIKEGFQICLKCKNRKELVDFYKNGCFDDGIAKYRSTCKSCILSSAATKNKLTYSNKIIKKHFSPKNYISTLLNRTSRRKKEHNIDIQYLLDIYESQKGLCNISGIRMTHIHGSASTNISIDRINSDLGYIKGNIQLVCYITNIMKNKFSMEELILFCKEIVNYNKNKENGI
jgi:hypothetical protein